MKECWKEHLQPASKTRHYFTAQSQKKGTGMCSNRQCRVNLSLCRRDRQCCVEWALEVPVPGAGAHKVARPRDIGVIQDILLESAIRMHSAHIYFTFYKIGASIGYTARRGTAKLIILLG